MTNMNTLVTCHTATDSRLYVFQLKYTAYLENILTYLPQKTHTQIY